MTIQRAILIGTIAIAALGVALVPAGGSAAPNIGATELYTGQIRQGAGGSTTTLTATGCTTTGPGATGNGTVIGVNAHVLNSGAGTDTGGGAKTIHVSRTGSTTVIVTEYAVNFAFATYTVPCNIVGTATTQAFTFIPRKQNGDATGIAQTVNVRYVKPPS